MKGRKKDLGVSDNATYILQLQITRMRSYHLPNIVDMCEEVIHFDVTRRSRNVKISAQYTASVSGTPLMTSTIAY